MRQQRDCAGRLGRARWLGRLAARLGVRVEPDWVYVAMRRLAAVMTPDTLSAVDYIVDTDAVRQTLDALTGCVIGVGGAATGAILVLDDDYTLRLVASHGPMWSGGIAISSGPHPAGTVGAAYAAIAARAPVVRQGPAGPGGRPTLVCVPLLSRETGWGVLCSYTPAGRRPSELQLAFLSLVAAQATSAVDRAQVWSAAREKATMDERSRLARDLHDSVSQDLYSIGLGARTARQLLDRDPERARRPIDDILELVEAGLAEMRALIFELRPEALAEEGLVAAIDRQIVALGRRYAMATHTALGPEPPLPMETKRVLYQIAREALQNIARHARASQVSVRLGSTPTDVTLEISDNGAGFDPTATFTGHLGLVSMRERVSGIRGDLDITSAPGAGTCIRAQVPMAPAR